MSFPDVADEWPLPPFFALSDAPLASFCIDAQLESTNGAACRKRGPGWGSVSFLFVLGASVTVI
jgi:hypothetical protein